jgi:hypothetical protein
MTFAPPPYHFGSPVDDRHFTDRVEELAVVTDRMLGSVNVVLHAPRRYGKTSLLKAAQRQVAARGGRTGYAHLLRCTSRRDVVETVVRAVFAGPLGRRASLRRLGGLAKRLRVQPTFTVGPDGSPHLTLEPGLAGTTDWYGLLDDAFGLLDDDGTGSAPVSLVLDEFQQVAAIDPGLADVFKGLSDMHPSVSLVIAGSHVHLMEQLTTEAGAPLLGMGEVIRLGPVPAGPMVAYLEDQATRAGSSMAPGAAARICELAWPVPNDIQHLAQTAFDLASGGIDGAVVDGAFALVVQRQSTTFGERFERLGGTAKRLLRRVAADPVAHPYTRAVLDELEAANANSVRQALDRLAAAELIVRREHGWEVADPFLRRWLLADDTTDQ